jgi:sugar phosphate isomerase/epimerase
VKAAASFSMLGDSPVRCETRMRLNDAGITVTEAEAALIRPGTNLGALEPIFEAAAYLGAVGLLCVFFDQVDEEQIAEQVAAVSSMMAPFKLQCLLEFLPSSALRSLSAAQRILGMVRSDNTGIICDILHLVRSGSAPSGVGAFDTRLIKSAQINDNQLEKILNPSELFDEAMTGRAFLGDGDFPVREFVARLPRSVPIGLEILSGEIHQHNRTPEEMANYCVDNIRKYFDLARVPLAPDISRAGKRPT